MSEEHRAKTPSSGTTWAVVSVVALVVYLLSPGFFVVAHMRWGWDPPHALQKLTAVLYSPINLLAKWEPVANFYNWYFSLCAGQDVLTVP